jgi:type II secretory pathway component PulF
MRYFRIDYRTGGKRDHVVLEAPSRIDAIKRFQTMTLGVMLSVREVSRPLSLVVRKWLEKYRSPIKQKRVSQEPYIAALRQVAVMLDAGIPINQALEEAVRSSDVEMLNGN